MQEATNSGAVAPALLKRLVLDARKLESLATAIDALRAAPNPLGKCTLATELTPGGQLVAAACAQAAFPVAVGVMLLFLLGYSLFSCCSPRRGYLHSCHFS